ncbi:hypothetical protein P692DRAFT_20811856 [Suillus brevipes Sb2]|nr:hypothetical protein P692DRAFT_20811856 [Suillus brevipes Sb2]
MADHYALRPEPSPRHSRQSHHVAARHCIPTLPSSHQSRIEWCKARARAMRWAEEVELLKEEMRRILQFFEWRAHCVKLGRARARRCLTRRG